MLAVVFYHAGVPWLGGGYVGVDVFFVISGFLITGGIVEELQQTKSLSLADFYVRRMARILPAASLAIVATVGLSWLVLPVTRWDAIGKDAAASSVYVVNWVFARNSVDYVALDQAPSPLQHMWSLAVEEQFYILWPVLLYAVYSIGRRRFTDRSRLLNAGALVAVPSLLWSIYYTAHEPSQAYFVTTTRMWELAIGAGLAIWLSSSRPRNAGVAAAVAGWAGLASIVFAAATYSDATPFPSYRALLPTIATAVLIWAGHGEGGHRSSRLLSVRPMVEVGAISYSLYLWHWPLLVLAAGVAGKLSTVTACILVVAAMVPAWLSTRYVEKPAQSFVRSFRGPEGPRLPKLVLGSTFTVAGVLAAVLLVQTAPSSRAPELTGPVGAEVLAPDGTVPVVDKASALTPTPTGAANDLAVVNTNGCMLDHSTTEPHVCSFGAKSSHRVIALIGDSHAAMYLPGLAGVAQDAGYRLDTYTKGSCPPVDIPIDFHGRDYVHCREWADNLYARLISTKPELVIAAMSREYTAFGTGLDATASRKPIADDLGAALQRLVDAGINVAGVRDVPRLGIVVPDCVAANLEHLSRCARPQAEVLPLDDQVTLAAKRHPAVSVLDFTPVLCGSGTCPAVIGRAIVYRDSNHLTATYARSMHAVIAKQVLPLLK